MGNGYCLKCNEMRKNQLTRHHIIPRSRGGGFYTRNIVILCKKCHREYHMIYAGRECLKTLVEFLSMTFEQICSYLGILDRRELEDLDRETY